MSPMYVLKCKWMKAYVCSKIGFANPVFFHAERKGDSMNQGWEVSCFAQLDGEIETDCYKDSDKETQLPEKGGEKNVS